MSVPVRRAGSGIAGDGSHVVWSQAEGTRGTRWRSVRSRSGHVVAVMMIETTPDGRVGRLELATERGLLTLHPEPHETALHGNVVSAAGVRHIGLDWSPGHVLVV